MQIEDRELESKLLEKYFRHLLKSDPILNKIGFERDIHPGGVRYQEKGKELITQKEIISARIEISFDDIINFKISNFCEQINKFAFEYLKSLHLSLFGTIKEIIDLTGNVFDAKGKPFSFDMVIDGLEKVEIDFDEEGKPKFPEFILSPELFDKIKDMKPTKEQDARLEKVIEEKKKKYYAQKCHRRLSYID